MCFFFGSLIFVFLLTHLEYSPSNIIIVDFLSAEVLKAIEDTPAAKVIRRKYQLLSFFKRGWCPFCFWCAVCLPVCCICIHANWCPCCLCAGGVHGVRGVIGVHGVRGVFDACLSDDDSTGCRQLPNVVSGSSTRRAKVADSRLRRPAPAYRSVLTQRPPELHLCRCVPKIMEKA